MNPLPPPHPFLPLARRSWGATPQPLPATKAAACFCGRQKIRRPAGGRRRLAVRGPLAPGPAKQKAQGAACGRPLRLWLSKKWLAPLFRGFHSSLAPTARPGSYAEKPLLRKAFCGFAVHAAKSDYSLRGLRPPNPQGFFDRLRRRGRPVAVPCAFQGASRPPPPPHPSAGLSRRPPGPSAMLRPEPLRIATSAPPPMGGAPALSRSKPKKA